MPILNDAELIQRIQGGSLDQAATAFEELVKRYGSRLFLHLRLMGLTSDEQEDIANESWERAWREIGRYEYRGFSFFAWIKVIAENVAREYIRRRYLRSDPSDPLLENLPAPESDAPEPVTLEHLTQDERRDAVRSLLTEAPEDYRLLIEAHFFCEFSTEEIQELYDWTASKVYTTKYRALNWLKQKLLERYGNYGGNHVLLAREISLVSDKALEWVEQTGGLSLHLDTLLNIINTARRKGLVIIEAHSHPFARDHVSFSPIDLEGQREIADYLAETLPGRPYGALVLGQEAINGCIWTSGNEHPLPLEEIRIVGDQLLRLPILSSRQAGSMQEGVTSVSNEEVFHRQILAIGKEGQRKILGTEVAIVGLGGIGSVVAQQLAHLGVQKFILVDDDQVEITNLHRLVGAKRADVGRLKVEVINDLIRGINPGARVETLAVSIRASEAISIVKNADVLFGCVDSDSGRLILNELALAYMLPYLDCGVGIQVGNNGLEEVGGKVSVWVPGRPCLLCTRDFNPRIAAEELESEEEKEFRRQRGYVEGALVSEPAVGSLNSTIASLAVTEFFTLVTSLRPSHHYTYYDLLEGCVGPRTVSHDNQCIGCALLGLGDRANLERYGRHGLPPDLPQLI